MRRCAQLIELRELSFSIRLLRRDARAGELRLLAAAIVIAIAALTPVVAEVFQISRFNKVITVYPDVATALVNLE